MANTHLAYPDLALDKFSGTDPDRDTESFVQLIERKINLALGDAPADSDDLVSYTFRKKPFFPLYFEDQWRSGMKIILRMPPLGQPHATVHSKIFRWTE